MVELDGASHHYEESMLNDASKEAFLKSLGLEVLRFEDNEVLEDIDNVLSVLMDYIERDRK